MQPRDKIAHLLFSLGLNGAVAVSFRNRLVNGSLAVNQRSAPDSPTVYEPGAFLRDRWHAGPSGCTAACKVSPNGDATIHIGAGSIIQLVEGPLYLPEGGAYCLSWQGTARGRVVASKPSSFATGPVVEPNHAPGANLAVEFTHAADGQPASLRLPQLEPGTTPTVFERRDDEWRRCQRYFIRLEAPPLRGVVCGGVAARCGMLLPERMRTAPQATLSGSLKVYDGEAISAADAIITDYSTEACLEVDLRLLSTLGSGRPAIVLSRQGGIFDLSAEL